MAFVRSGMDKTNVGKELPNLKIEIENDLDSRMEIEEVEVVKDTSYSEEESAEEGELIEIDDIGLGEDRLHTIPLERLKKINSGRSILRYNKKEPVGDATRHIENSDGGFVTGVNVFSPEEQAKLDKRAKRFGLESSEGKALTQKLLKKLYKSMGITSDDPNLRLDALHVRGVEEMSTQDVFKYFKDYGPASLEWINDYSCNVVWLDDISAARALLGLSVQISDKWPPSQQDSKSDSLDQTKVDNKSDSDLSEESDTVTPAEVSMPLPPGCWRKGAPHPNAKCILLRFATRTDRQTQTSCVEPYTYTGLISESRKRRIQQGLLGNQMFEDVGDEIVAKPRVNEVDSNNPWGVLALNWSNYDRNKPKPVVTKQQEIVHRITPPPSPQSVLPKRVKLVAKTKRRRNIPERLAEGSQQVSDKPGDSSESDDWGTRNKLPRMRMYADDEEEKIQRKHKREHTSNSRNKNLSTQCSEDLRQKLGSRIHKPIKKHARMDLEDNTRGSEESDDEIPDLRVAVCAEGSPEDSKVGIRESLFQTGNVKSVLKGARTHSDNESSDFDSTGGGFHKDDGKGGKDDGKGGKDDGNSSNKSRSSSSNSSIKLKLRRRHRSRSKEKKQRGHHKSKLIMKSRNQSSKSVDKSDLRSSVQRRSPEKYIGTYDSDDVIPHQTKDLRSKLGRQKKNESRPKSPLQIEIDNDEYYKLIDSE